MSGRKKKVYAHEPAIPSGRIESIGYTCVKYACAKYAPRRGALRNLIYPFVSFDLNTSSAYTTRGMERPSFLFE